MRRRAFVVALALILAPLGAKAADLVVWWEKGWNPQEDEAIAEIIAAFEQDTGKQVELEQPLFNEIGAKGPGRGRGGAAARFPMGLRSELFLRSMGLRGPAR